MTLIEPERRRRPREAAGQASRGTVLLLIAPALLIFVVFTLYPVARTVFNSFHVIGPRGISHFVGLRNFAALLTTDQVFWKAVWNTTLFSLVGTVADVLGLA